MTPEIIEPTVTKNVIVNLLNEHQAKVPTKNADGRTVQYFNSDGVPLIPMIQTVQPLIEQPPCNKEDLWNVATRSDNITVRSWEKIWLDCLEKNSKNFDFNKLSCMSEYLKEDMKPVIIAGSGPSLKKNAFYLNDHIVPHPFVPGKNTIGGGRKNIRIVSALHNFGYFEDNNIMTKDDYYVTLDSGDITISEVSEGGGKTPEEYWEISKDRTLVAALHVNPELLKKWQGRIIFFMVPSDCNSVLQSIESKIDKTKVPPFQVGGNVLGASLYFARAILGAGPVIFIGADFSFGYDHKFHSWDSQYDSKFSGVEAKVDIFGNKVFTWPSYFGFKCWFDYIACGGAGSVGQLFINATEGGILGAYPEGNIKQILQIPLKGVLEIFTRPKLKQAIMDNGVPYTIF